MKAITLKLLWGVLVAAIICLGVYGVIRIVSGAADIVAATLTGVATLSVALLTQAYQRARELEIERIRRMKEAYLKIIGDLGAYIRDPEENKDSFTESVLSCFVIGSEDVAYQAGQFIEKRDHTSLDNMISAMRSDLHVGAIYFGVDKLTTKGLYDKPAAPKEPGTLQ